MTLLKKLPSCISRTGAFGVGAGSASEAASMNGRGWLRTSVHVSVCIKGGQRPGLSLRCAPQQA
ncbi:hypothetical protein [Paenibacillus chitinolyticus]|uniref:hypothetical protein n=1 Tax=Paenibacillus chitinolyticus TaxID=79263 RepID=UPI003671798E